MKKVITIALAAAMCMSMAITSMARAPICDDCGEKIRTTTEAGSWVIVGTVSCDKNPNEDDYRVRRQVKEIIKCGCGSEVVDSYYEYDVECDH